MGRFRRRKPAVCWLPVSGTENLNQQVIAPIISGDVFVAGSGAVQTSFTALTFDYGPELLLAANELPTLADYQGSAYRLRRIVGKCFISMTQESPLQPPAVKPAAAIIAAAFIVLRVNEETGTPLLNATPDQYNPLNEDNIRDPFIWRRSWILSNGLSASPSQPQWGEMPFSNVEYGSAFDGAHIDQKTARVIGPEERLFFVIGTQSLEAAAVGENSHIRYVLDYRLLASMRRTAGNRRNASR